MQSCSRQHKDWGVNMEVNDIFKSVQKAVEEIPLMLIGSGSSAPYGLPTMGQLGNHLLSNLTSKYYKDSSWMQFESNLSAGMGLEEALTGVVLSEEIIDDIRKKTWELVSSKDINLFYKVLFGEIQLPLAKLIKHFYQTYPQCVNIITTNYDRVIEYACDSVQIPLYTGFEGQYEKHYVGTFLSRKIVNLIKVHGSLDYFKDSHEVSYSLPLQNEIPVGLSPEIITPGISKYQAVLKGTPRHLLNECDKLVNGAHSYLCIGYGFNDEQIQEGIMSNIRMGKPIVVVTMDVSDKAAHLLVNNAKHYITIQKGELDGTTEFCIDKEILTVDGTYWTVEGFLDIIS